MRPAAPARHLVGAVRMVFLVDRHRDPPAAVQPGQRHEGMRRLRERRVVVVGRDRGRLADVGDIDDAHAAMPAAGPEQVVEAQRMVQPVLPARPGLLLAASGMLPGHPPARHFLGALGICQAVVHQDVSGESLHLGRDVGVVRVHVEAVYADSAGTVVHQLARLRPVGDVVDAEATEVIPLLLRRLDHRDVRFGHTDLRRQLRMGRFAAE